MLAPALEPGRILGVDRRADLAQEAQVTVAGVAAHGLELVAEHRSQAHGHWRAVEQVEKREVGAGHRFPQPLLPEGPGAEALHVGHVRVEHERQRPRALLAHAGSGLGSGLRARGTARQPATTRMPTTIAASGSIASMATVLKAAWTAITAKSEPVRS